MHSSDEESSEEEIINRNPTKTRSGRTSTPRHALNKDNFKTPNMTKTEEATPQGGSGSSNQPTAKCANVRRTIEHNITNT